MSDERSLFDSFERLVNARLKCVETLALTVMKRTTSLEARMAALEQPHTPAQALPMESERERHGRLLFEANASLRMHNFPKWETQSSYVRTEYCEFADLFVKAADLVPLAQVRSEITMLDEGSSKDNDDFAWGWRDACHAMSNVLTQRYGKETE